MLGSEAINPSDNQQSPQTDDVSKESSQLLPEITLSPIETIVNGTEDHAGHLAGSRVLDRSACIESAGKSYTECALLHT